MTARVKIVFYSMYGHIYRLAEAVADGAREVPGTEVELLQVPELVPEDILERSGAKKAREAFAHIPVAAPNDLADADAVIFGIPARYGNMCAQMRNFLDQTGSLWAKGALVGKVGSVFASSNCQHGGQETTIISSLISLLHHGMVLVGLPYTEMRQCTMDEITGGSPYGATAVVGQGNDRMPSENELTMARFQGRHVATITQKLASK
jgi:NAD(P)H:quinone oxidoreductase type IV